ncbi:hypothetical protein GCM10023172_24680 [Hymenobacter ginsengisoli]|uniref:Uncharacterized protein n=1 Tax=Hymenobacter ginsengisoli TaxID=1051626 RepID=A0ABP8QEV8_9BACT|nr:MULTISPECIES: hypothetical protein [unclassified Hymenobacter]MBO2030273.1 hypothetical protein [Hymenobacter sp. BT559]
MLRRLLLPLLGIALFASEAASAQTLPAPAAQPVAAPAQPVAGAYSHPAARAKVLTAREKRAAEAAAKAEAAKAVAVAPPAQPDAAATAGTSWNGWSNEPTPQATDATFRPATNLSVAPGIPLNQVGHGVTTDYNGRPLHHEVVSTSISTGR